VNAWIANAAMRSFWDGATLYVQIGQLAVAYDGRRIRVGVIQEASSRASRDCAATRRRDARGFAS
jgi:hypothetical protein